MLAKAQLKETGEAYRYDQIVVFQGAEGDIMSWAIWGRTPADKVRAERLANILQELFLIIETAAEET